MKPYRSKGKLPLHGEYEAPDDLRVLLRRPDGAISKEGGAASLVCVRVNPPFPATRDGAKAGEAGVYLFFHPINTPSAIDSSGGCEVALFGTPAAFRRLACELLAHFMEHDA